MGLIYVNLHPFLFALHQLFCKHESQVWRELIS